MDYTSTTGLASQTVAGAQFRIRKMSFERRVDLMRRVRELLQRVEFLEGGNDPREHAEANLLAAEIDRTFLLWGLVEVTGLTIDGQAATPESLAAAGPEGLCREIVTAVKRQCGLTEDERKN